MWWIGMGLGSVAGVVVLRVLLRQVRGLLLDIGDLVCAWTEVFVEYRQQGGPRGVDAALPAIGVPASQRLRGACVGSGRRSA